MKVEFEKLGTEGAAALRQALNRLAATPAWQPTAIPPPAPA
jgi:hypothetical protein